MAVVFVYASDCEEATTRTMMEKTMRRILLWLLFVGGAFFYVPWHAPSVAKQLHFDRQDEGDKVAFSYRYQDSVQHTEELDFALPRTAIEASESLLLDNAALDRAASKFILVEGQQTAARHLEKLQAEFDAAIAVLQSTIATFNGRIGGKIVSMRLKEPQNLNLELSLSEQNLLDIKISSLVPGMTFARKVEDLETTFTNDTKAIVAQANASLPKGLRFSIVKRAGGISFPLKNSKLSYDKGTRARAGQTVSETNARLRTRVTRHKKDLEEVGKFMEGIKERARNVITEASQGLASTRQDLIAEMKTKKLVFYSANYLLPSKKNKDRTLIDYARIARQALPRLHPVAHAFRSSAKGKNEREQVADVLHFFQNIPYNDLTKGKVRGFLGFAPPIEVLSRNLGDCDSKSTAMMGLLRLLLEDRSVAIFLVPKHAFLGVEMEAQEGDATYTHQGTTYVLMEPTGPRVRPIGSLLKVSSEHLQAGRIDDIVTLLPR